MAAWFYNAAAVRLTRLTRSTAAQSHARDDDDIQFTRTVPEFGVDLDSSVTNLRVRFRDCGFGSCIAATTRATWQRSKHRHGGIRRDGTRFEGDIRGVPRAFELRNQRRHLWCGPTVRSCKPSTKIAA